MTTEELAAFIFRHRLEKLESGEDGLVDPVSMDAVDRLMLEEWSLTQARKLKTKDAYLELQARGVATLRKMVAEVHEEHAREGTLQGLEIQASMVPRAKKLLN